ncbi:unnamed protein product [Oreochromis niloticus]|nr:unnamed protein product [Mustela putorius furo]
MRLHLSSTRKRRFQSVISAMLSIHPDRSQFFWYDTITLSCEGTDNSGNWTLKRNTSIQTAESCISGWGVSNQTSCTIMDTYASDTGIYWCESDRRECSETINITVTYGVILESPALPVTEDETVTLFCYYKYDEESSTTSNFSGFYKCEHPTKGQSAQSWMAVKSKVRAQPSVSVPGLIGAILVKLFYTVIITLGANVLIR